MYDIAAITSGTIAFSDNKIARINLLYQYDFKQNNISHCWSLDNIIFLRYSKYVCVYCVWEREWDSIKSEFGKQSIETVLGLLRLVLLSEIGLTLVSGHG